MFKLFHEKPQDNWQLRLLGNFFMFAIQIKAGERFASAFNNYSSGCKFCTTANGFMGWVPAAAQTSDALCYSEANPLPFVVRKYELQGYRMIGDSYIHGMMRGPPLDGWIWEHRGTQIPCRYGLEWFGLEWRQLGPKGIPVQAGMSGTGRVGLLGIAVWGRNRPT